MFTTSPEFWFAGSGLAVTLGTIGFKVVRAFSRVESKVDKTAEQMDERYQLAVDTKDTLIKHADHVNGRLGKIELLLVGPEGTNGIRGDVTELKQLVAGHTTDLAVINNRRSGPRNRRQGSPERRAEPRIVPKRRRA